MKGIFGILFTFVLLCQLSAEETVRFYVEQLGSALDSRVETIGDPSSTTLKREERKLRKAGRALNRYTGSNDRRDFRRLEKAGKLVGRSQTVDASVLSAAGGLVRRLALHVESQRDLAQATAEVLASDSVRHRVDRINAKGAALLERGQALMETDSLGAQKLFTRAQLVFLRSQRRTQVLHEREQQGKLPALCVIVNPRESGAIVIYNVRPGPIDLENIRYNLTVTRVDALGVTTADALVFTARDLDPEAFSANQSHVEPFTTYDITRWLPGETPEGVTSLRIQGEIHIVTQQLETIVVAYDHTFES